MDSSPPFNLLPPPPPPPPDPNPNYIFPPYNNHHHHYNPSAAPTNVPAQPSDLHATLSTLKHIINLSKTTINSLSNLHPATAASATCPYNFNHRVPPTSLFRHHLQCPSSPAPIDLAILHSLHYPNSIQSSYYLLNQKNNCFTQKLPKDANTDLCFSLDDYHTSIDSNFFYRDCPAVVTFPYNDHTRKCMLSLPTVLSAECTNLAGDDDDDMSDTIDGLSSSSYLIELLPSEYCNIRAEINQWNDYPSFYSHGVCRSVVCSYVSQKDHVKEWIVINSPFYGVVIDEFMRDHILLLFRLCLKAIAREAIGYLFSITSGEPTDGKQFFECPAMVRVLMWLASQLAILYGEVNGKLFAVNMFKQSLLIASSKSLFVFGEQRVRESPSISEVDGEIAPLKENDGNTMGIIFVSQVAAAVAALHERSAFERSIKAIRSSQSLPVYQRVQEHGYISQKAEEERGKRSNYRPIIEHDGVLWQRGGNQDGNKNKSREELLAEERDYKRRRMSYRGKKMKRSTTQVMKDIIEEYMDEIKHANLDGPLVDTTKLASEPSSMGDMNANTKARIVVTNSSMLPQKHRKESVSDVSMRSEDETKKQINKHRHDGQQQEYDAIDESRYRREYLSNTADGRKSTSHSHDHGQRDEQKHYRKYNPSSPDRGHNKSHEQVNRRRHHVHEYVDFNDSHQRSKHRNKNTSSIVRNEFEDRYDPSRSHDIEEGGLYSDS